MPLRDHFRPPVDLKSSWQELHGGWPMVICQHLKGKLPAGFTAGPLVRLGSEMEVDIAAFDREETGYSTSVSGSNGGVALAEWAPATLAVETELPEFDEYEVRIYDAKRGRRLVAAIEIVSPANKDRPERRNAFVAKCAALLRQGIAVSIVDIVTIRPFNLHAETLAFLGHSDPSLGDPPPATYATSCRWVKRGKRSILEAWTHVLSVGEPMPKLPIWLGPDLVVPHDLERSYEQACHDVWIE